MELKLTPTERKLFEALEDGEPHDPKELLLIIGDEFTSRDTLWQHLSNLRVKIRHTGETVLAQSFGHKVAYRRVILRTAPKT